MAEKAASKYVQNTYSANIQIDLRSETGRYLKSVVFSRYSVDKSLGTVISDGFTEVDAETYAMLEKSKAFALMVKSGKLVVQDKAPLRAGSFEQMLAAQQRIQELEATNAELVKKIEELEKAAGVTSGAESTEGTEGAESAEGAKAAKAAKKGNKAGK